MKLFGIPMSSRGTPCLPQAGAAIHSGLSARGGSAEGMTSFARNNRRKRSFRIALSSIVMIALAGLLMAPFIFIHAAAAEEAPYSSGAPVERELIVPIGGLTRSDTPPGEYINKIYTWGIGLAALLALGQLVLGGVLYTLSAGSLANQENAKKHMKGAVTGLILLIAGATLLITINPKLANLKQTGVGNDVTAFSTLDTVDPDLLRRAEQLGPSEEAFKKARDRINANTRGNIEDCVQATNKMRQEIYEYGVKRDVWGLGADDPDIHEITDDVGTGIFQGSADFLEYLTKAKDAKNASKSYEYHCYQDSLITATYYAKKSLKKRQFALVAEALENFPDELEAKEYLKSDPFDRSAVTVEQSVQELIDSFPQNQEYVNNMKQRIDMGQIDEVANSLATYTDNILVFHKNSWPSTKQMLKSITSYAQTKLAATQYQTFTQKLTDAFNKKPRYYKGQIVKASDILP